MAIVLISWSSLNALEHNQLAFGYIGRAGGDAKLVFLNPCFVVGTVTVIEEIKGEVYKALVLPALLYGCEAWSLREDLFKRLRSFHNRCARLMCRVNLHHTFRHHITTSNLFRRMNLLDIDSYYHNRLLHWAGHVARMPMSRAPRQLLTSWVAHSRPVGCPQMTWGRTLENALASKGISKEFKEWIAIAKDRPKWRQQTHSKPKPPDA